MNINTKDRKIILCMLILVMSFAFVCAGCGKQENFTNPAGDDPVFSLNGEDYPIDPVILDFTERGWKLGEAGSYTARSYTPEDGPSDLVPDGYYLTSGDNEIYINLNAMKALAGYDTETCKINSIRLYGDDVDSFMMNGIELSNISYNEIEDLLGPAGFTENLGDGIEYGYYFPEKNIDEIHFYFPYSRESVTQIYIILK